MMVSDGNETGYKTQPYIEHMSNTIKRKFGQLARYIIG